MGLTRLAIRNATTVFILIFIIFVIGLRAYLTLPREGSPDIQIPVVIVSIPYFGVASKDIETLVTVPVEKKLKELSDVKEITSTSAESASAITIEFEPDIDIDDALQKVRDKVDLAKPDLPQDAEDPVILEINFSDFPIMFINLAGDIGLNELKRVGEKLEDDIEEIPGILDVDLIGGLEREIRVTVDADRLDAYNLSFSNVITTLQAQNVNVPGGSIEVGDMKYLVRVPGEFERVDEIENIVVKAPEGNPIYLRDVATVTDGFEDRSTYARLDGKESLTLSIQKRSGENIIQASDRIKLAIEDYRKEYPQLNFTVTTDASDFIRDILKDLQNNMITGFLLVLLLLFLTLGFLNASFVAMAIPLSMMVTFATLQVMGISLNFIVLFAIIVALGMLVDNSVVIVEGAYRLMQEGASRKEAAEQAAAELGGPLISSTLTTLAAFFPLLFWPGVTGEFMGYFPKLLIISLTASLFIAVVINPVFAAKFMRIRKGTYNPEGEVRHPAMRAYAALLRLAVKWRYVTVGLTIALFVGTIMLYGQLGKGVIFFSQEDPAVADVEIRAPEGTRVEVTNQIAQKVEKIVEKYREGNIEFVITNVGSPSQNEGPGGGGGGEGGAYSHIARVTLDFEDVEKRQRSSKTILADIRKDVQALAGAEFEIKEQSNGPPAGAPVSVELIGEDFEELARLTEEIKAVMAQVPGVVDLRDNFNLSKPELTIAVDRSKASLLKLDPRSIGNAIRTAINGTDASKFREFDEEYDINVRLSENRRQAIEDVARLNIANFDDEPIPLTSVASIETRSGAGAIRRKDSDRTVTIDANVEGRFANAVLADVQKALDTKMRLPQGYRLKYGGEQEDQQESGAFLSQAFLLAVLLIFLILVTQFNSFILPVIILTTVVLSIMGVLMGQMISGTPFSIILSGLGVVSLAGVVVNNGIVMIDYIEQLKREGFAAEEAVIRAGIVRLRPVLLTAVTTLLGLLPSILGFSVDFTTLTFGPTGETSRLFNPLSVAVFYGLFVSTALTLVFVPAIYMIIDNLRNLGHRLALRIQGLFTRRRTVLEEESVEGPQA
ncbi:MAG: efflux RND transporter permease subunit [Candidatus Sericytochromatia bacterium]